MQEGHMQSLQDSEYCLSLEERNNYLGARPRTTGTKTTRQNDVHDEPHDDTSGMTRSLGLVLCLVVFIKVIQAASTCGFDTNKKFKGQEL